MRHISRYEYARLMGARVTQLANNAQSDCEKESGDLLAIAEQEFVEQKVPLQLVCRYPNGNLQMFPSATLRSIPKTMMFPTLHYSNSQRPPTAGDGKIGDVRMTEVRQ